MTFFLSPEGRSVDCRRRRQSHLPFLRVPGRQRGDDCEFQAVVHTGPAGGNIGFPAQPEEIGWFVTMLKKARAENRGGRLESDRDGSMCAAEIAFRVHEMSNAVAADVSRRKLKERRGLTFAATDF
jgi:hypothetical protein